MTEFVLDNVPGLRPPLVNRYRGCRQIGERIATISRGHILKHQYPQFIGPIIPALRLDLHMLSEGVESQLLCPLDIKPQRLVGRGQIDTVRPVSLIQSPRQHDRLAIEHQPGVSIGVMADSHTSHAEIAIDGIQFFSGLVFKRYRQVIEERLVRRPRFG